MDRVDFFDRYKEHPTINILAVEFKCAVCQLPLIEPYLLSCSHVYCVNCERDLFVQNERLCKICNEIIDQSLKDRRIIKKLKEIVIPCLNSDKCEWRGDITIFENHCRICGFISIPCDLNCNTNILRNELYSHKSNICEERQIKCEYCDTNEKSKDYNYHLTKLCNEIPVECPNECKIDEKITKLKRKDIESHTENCPNQNMPCCICDQLMIRKDKDQHIKDEIYSHLSKINQEIRSLKENEEFQNNKISQNMEEIKKLKEIIEDLQVKQISKEEELQKLKEEHNDKLRLLENSLNQISPLSKKITLNHGSYVMGLLQFSDQLLISGGFCDLKFWNLNDYTLIYTIDKAHTSWLSCLRKFDKEKFISSSEDLSIKIWNIKTFEVVKTFTEHINYVLDIMVFSSNKIASASSDNTIKIWDINSNESINTFDDHTDWVRRLIKMGEEVIISCSKDKSIKVWDLNIDGLIKSIPAHSSDITSLLKINDSLFASGSKQIKLWNYPSGTCVMTLLGHNDLIWNMISNDDNTIASASQDKTIKLWDISTGLQLNNLTYHTDRVNRLVILNKTDLGSGSHDKKIIILRNYKNIFSNK